MILDELITGCQGDEHILLRIRETMGWNQWTAVRDPGAMVRVELSDVTGDPMLILGEVHTGLLQNSTAVPAARCEHILALVQGRAVRQFERPIDHAASPELLTGVDCRLATGSGARIRGIGTVAHRATITGGHLLQTSATVHVTGSRTTRRLPWSHYLALPGEVETIGRPDWDDLAHGHLAARPPAATLDLGGITGRVMDHLQASTLVDRSPPIRARRTRLRWVAFATDQAGTGDKVRFGVEADRLRTLRLPRAGRSVAAVAGFCEDLALHDWLLTTLLQLIERSQLEGLSS